MVEKTKRTEDEKLSSALIDVELGGKTYQVKPLVIKESRAWRQEAGTFQASIVKFASVSSENAEEFEAALKELLVGRIDQIIDLFFKYAKDLDRNEIEMTATDAEIAAAFEKVVAVAFPFG